MKKYIGLIAIVIIAFIACGTTVGVRAVNNWNYSLQKADDQTNYKTLKKVEDSCRAMIASYEADKLTYEQYKDSVSKEELSWSSQAKMRANKTAVTYNSYILENSFVWKDAVPDDISSELSYLE